MTQQTHWLHQHPFEPFLPKQATHLIVGTLPPPRFSLGSFKKGDVNFCYGSADGMLWPILDRIYDLQLSYETTARAIAERKRFLSRLGIGICDIVDHCYRQKVDASDRGMESVQLRDFFSYLQRVPKVHTLLFTGGASKNGPEYFFRRYVQSQGYRLHLLDATVPRKHYFQFKGRTLVTHSLTAPSGAANRAVGRMDAFKQQKARDPTYSTFDFRVSQYAQVFPKIY